MATLPVNAGSLVELVAAQSGASFDTNILDRGPLSGPVALLIDSTAGTTITANIMGSIDGVNFFNVEYSLVATPSTKAVAAITITTTTKVTYLVSGGYGWRFLKVAFTANTGMTINQVAAVAH
jgi:hypothetical protein